MDKIFKWRMPFNPVILSIMFVDKLSFLEKNHYEIQSILDR